jgi:acyl-CoA dehydrogenase-like protein
MHGPAMISAVNQYLVFAGVAAVLAKSYKPHSKNSGRRTSLDSKSRAELWNTVAAGEETTLEQRARCRLASTYTADSAREAMDLVYRHGGSTSFKRESRLAECWRDLHTVGQTVTLAPEWYPIGGRVYLGVDPGPRLR